MTYLMEQLIKVNATSKPRKINWIILLLFKNEVLLCPHKWNYYSNFRWKTLPSWVGGIYLTAYQCSVCFKEFHKVGLMVLYLLKDATGQDIRQSNTEHQRSGTMRRSGDKRPCVGESDLRWGLNLNDCIVALVSTLWIASDKNLTWWCNSTVSWTV